ncbi:MAG: GNAT family N-acetyltransferase [Gammaproteobacteria bacterium]
MSNKMYVPRIELEGLVLEVPTNSIIDSIIKYYRSNRKYLGKYAATVNQCFMDHEFWISKICAMHNDYEEDKACNFCILNDRRDVIGVINYFNIIRGAFHCCILGYSLDESRQGRGIMARTLSESIKYMFDKKHSSY